jgi:hypothetical protein
MARLALRTCLAATALVSYLWPEVTTTATSRGHQPPLRHRRRTVLLFPTHFRKRLPVVRGDTLRPCHINSGFCYMFDDQSVDKQQSVSRLIVVFRREEWQKVLIHEVFHACGVDSWAPSAAEPHIRALQTVAPLPIESTKMKFMLGEAIVEFLACLMHCVAPRGDCAHCSPGRRAGWKKRRLGGCRMLVVKDQILAADKQVERLLLHFITMPVAAAHQSSSRQSRPQVRVVWRETTNAYAYFVLKASLLHHTDLVAQWALVDSRGMPPDARLQLFALDVLPSLIRFFAHPMPPYSSTTRKRLGTGRGGALSLRMCAGCV